MFGTDLDAGVIYFRSPDPDEDGCVHELWHIKLSRQGCPEVLLVRDNESNLWRLEIPHFLNDLFEHQLFFPELVSHGYSPYEIEESALKSFLDQMTTQNIGQKGSSIQITEEQSDPARAYLSIIYAKAFLECRSEALQKRCVAIYSMPYLLQTKKLGEGLIDIVRTYAGFDFKKFKIGLELAVQLLSQSDFMKINVAA